MAQITLLDDNKIVYFDENTGNYKIFDGERWWLDGDKFGTSTKPSGVALVDSAIVDKSVVGEEERPPMQTIWEGTFTGTERTQGGVTNYVYETNDIQNAELLMDIDEVTVTFDGVQYTLQVESYLTPGGGGGGASFGSTNPQFEDFPFVFGYEYDNEEKFVGVMTQTAGPHTIKVEYTPSPEPTLQTIWEGTFTGLRYLTEDIQNASLLRNAEEVTVTFDGVVYTATVTKQTSEDVSAYTFGASDPSFSDYPFSFGWTDSRTPVITMIAQTDGEHTIKVECIPSPEPPMQTIWEGTFDDTEYIKDVPNIALLQDAEEVTVTFDGVVYTATVNKNVYSETTTIYGCGASDSSFIEYPFSFHWTGGDSFVAFGAKTSGEHTIKIETTDETAENPGGGSAIDLPGGEIAL